jgi:hypothetical protein
MVNITIEAITMASGKVTMVKAKAGIASAHNVDIR